MIRFISWTMSKGWSMEITRQLLIENIGKDLFFELEPSYRDSMPVHIPKGKFKYIYICV